jgi:regulator of replication initiation timing
MEASLTKLEERINSLLSQVKQLQTDCRQLLNENAMLQSKQTNAINQIENILSRLKTLEEHL